MATAYIIYSEKEDKYYIGATKGDVNIRLSNHNNSKYGSKSFTSKAFDWKLKLTIAANDFSQAIRIERKIKSMKSRKYIEKLMNSEEMVQKLKEQTKST